MRGRLGVVAIDLRDVRRIVQRPRERFPLASTFKLPLAMAVLKRVDRGAERLDRRIRFTAATSSRYSPVVAQQPHGGTLRVGAAVRRGDRAQRQRRGESAARDRRRPARRDGVHAPARRRRHAPRPQRARAQRCRAGRRARHDDAAKRWRTCMARLVRSRVLTDASKMRLYGWLRAAKTGLTRIRAGRAGPLDRRRQDGHDARGRQRRRDPLAAGGAVSRCDATDPARRVLRGGRAARMPSATRRSRTLRAMS